MFADEVGDAGEVIKNELGFVGAGEEQDEFAGDGVGGFGDFGTGAKIAEDVFRTGGRWEIPADEGVGGGAEVEGLAGDLAVGDFGRAGDGVDFVGVGTFEEAGVGVGSTEIDDGIGLVAADGEDKVGETGGDIAAACCSLGLGEALDGGVVDFFGRFFVEGDEIEEDLQAREDDTDEEESAEGFIGEAGREDILLDAEAEEGCQDDDKAKDDGEDMEWDFGDDDREPDGEVQEEEAEGIDDGAVTDFGGEGLDIGEGVIGGFAEILEGFVDFADENEVEENEETEDDAAGQRGVGGAYPLEILENGDESERDEADGDAAEGAEGEKCADDAELDIFGPASAVDFFDEVAGPDEPGVRDRVVLVGGGLSCGGLWACWLCLKMGLGLSLGWLRLRERLRLRTSAGCGAGHKSVSHLITFHSYYYFSIKSVAWVDFDGWLGDF